MKTVADIDLLPRDRQAIDAAVRLLRAQFPIDKVILYGSKATGKDVDESDIDLLLLTSRELSWRERDAITDALFDIQLTYEVVISTLVVPAPAWRTGPYLVLPIHDEIERDGVAV